MKNTLPLSYPCCKHSMKLSHCYFHEINQFYLYTSSDKSFYVAQMHFCNAEPLVMLPVILQASIPFWITCVRKAIKNVKSYFEAPNFKNQGCQLCMGKCLTSLSSAKTPTNQSTVSSKLDVECQKRKWLSAFSKSNCNFNFWPSNLFYNEMSVLVAFCI